MLDLLSPAEREAAQSASYLWRIFFGRALERDVAANPAVRELFEYAGQRADPDFILTTTRSAYELTTSNAGTIVRHLARTYVDPGRLISYLGLG